MSFASPAAWLRRRKRPFLRAAHVVVPLGLLLLSVEARIVDWTPARLLESKVFDYFQRLRPRPYEKTDVRIVDLDDETLSRLGQWPWPRTLVAKLVDRLTELGAKAIAFDIVFAEPDRTSPRNLTPLWPKSGGWDLLREKVKSLPDHDQILARSIAKSKVVTGFVLVPDENAASPVIKEGFAGFNENLLALLPDYPGAVVNLQVLEKAASGNGVFTSDPDGDGIVRHVPLIYRHGGQLAPSLAAEALRVYSGQHTYGVKGSKGSQTYGFGVQTGINMVKIGPYKIPTDQNGRVWIYYTEPARVRTIPVWRLFEKNFDGARVAGAIVFVGTSAAGLKDQRATPLDPQAPGVEVHAQIAEEILLEAARQEREKTALAQGESPAPRDRAPALLQRPDWAKGAEVLYMVALGLLLVLLLPRLGAGWCASIGLAALSGAFWFSWHAFVEWHYLLDPVLPSSTVVAVYLASSSIGYLRSEVERKQIRGAFGQYLHPKLVEELAKHPEKLKLGGETREMTILFCDIRGFTTISEQYDAHGLTQVINRFLTPMSTIIMERLGYIDKYIGDCIMAFWNAPADDAEHAVNACRSAIEMHRRLGELNARWEAEAKAESRKFIPIHIGVGLNTGPCCVGNMGADQKFNYSVLGDDVNLASRLEGQSKTYGMDTVIGPKTKELAAGFAAIELDLIRVKGKTIPVNIFGLLGDKEVLDGAAFKDLQASHARMLEAYRAQRWDEAEALIQECRKAPFRLEKLYRLYEDRIAAYRATPPAADWDGTFTATTK